MEYKKELKIFLYLFVGFLVLYFLPIESEKFNNGIFEALALSKWYAREHVVLCLIPAFLIAGAISVFLKQDSVMKYLGAGAPKVVSYSVASVSGTILAVCSCTVLPLFAGIYTMGAGIGPATAFLYSGPAINVLAIVLTARVLGAPIGIARAVGAVVFSLIVGLLMAYLFKKSEAERQSQNNFQENGEDGRPLYQNALFFFSMVGILVFANWGKTNDVDSLFYTIYSFKWVITSVFSIGLFVILTAYFNVKLWKIALTIISILISYFVSPNNHILIFSVGVIAITISALTTEGEMKDWIISSWDFTKQILPLLLFGVLIAGFALGRPGHEGVIPSTWVSNLVGGNTIFANFFSSISGAFMYFATLTEVPIVEGLIGNGMGKGPALSLLLAGPALSLPNMLVIKSVLGTKKTVVFVTIVVIMATITGYLFGLFY